MSQEQANPSDEQTPPGPTPDQLALNAAFAMGVQEWWAKFCQPAIDANRAFIRDNPGVLTTVAAADGVRIATFTESVKRPYFEITDPAAFLEWADGHGETVFIVRKAFEDAILKKRARDVNGECVDSVTGEVIPGVTRNPGGTHLSVKPTFTEAGAEKINSFLDELFRKTSTALPMLSPAPAEDAEGTE